MVKPTEKQQQLQLELQEDVAGPVKAPMYSSQFALP